MPCTISSGRSVSCKDATGGIKGVYIHNYSDTANFTGYGATAANVIQTLGGSGGGEEYDVFKFAIRREMASLTVDTQSDVTTGTTFFEQVFTCTFTKLTQSDANNLSKLAAGRPQIIVEDNQGNLILLGHTNGMDVTGGTFETGKAFSDLNGMSLTFTGREIEPFFTLVGTSSGGTVPFTAFPHIDIDPS
ncbi:MAG: hypothetical protein Unbinned1446contig1005_5 [Prokaryotic dsDNA virus sp.]|nr:MAG: hypothetical protein Unbinned1446contig1005_5 [Prokaryotic dsDNA virus sp.]|tara:strand:+ start:4772 stop:5341 length:570 start_codon:yes stop_codon:yes gene_type:complete